ncbi:ABC-type multidrug transport system fused ATPase/permease subunit [Flavimobilis soli]|uniref:ABC-type multidrug transport system fused ATPase/permease subunit n=1 Tax=Flavimobilis soli TaxID=442709 RepID=A0A2A9EBV9_9MICO|nr:ABC transporter ATP-binding protein [Flavimobilis soli]PFG35742.1 ABC-type multidrug transport system fused ATPase/permease subunit [Flavimobilis soli]
MRRPHALPGSRARQSIVLMARGIRDEWRTYVLAIGISAIGGALTVAVSVVLGRATDSVVVPALSGADVTPGDVWRAGAAIAAAALALALSVAGRRIFAGIGYAKLGANHRRAVTHRFLELPVSWHRSQPTGQLLAHASSDAEAATGVFNPLPFALGVAVMLVVATVQLFAVDAYLAVAALVVLPLVLAVNVVFQRRMTPAVTAAQQLRGAVSDTAHESFEAGLLVKALGTAEREERRFDAVAQELRAANVRAGRVRAYFDPLIELLPSLGTLLVLGVGAWRASTGAVGTGEIVAAAYLLTMLAVPVRAFGWVLGELPRALVGYERISRVIDADGDLVPGTGALPPRDSLGVAVDLDGVSVVVPTGRGPVKLLSDVSLHVDPGTVVAVVGPTGAGKTTLVSLLARLFDPTDGTVRLDGVDARDLSTEQLTSAVALVGQSTFVFEDTVRANVTLQDADDPSAPSDDAVWAALDQAHVGDVVRALPGGLDAPLGERGASLSGGQRQRLAFARALVRRPRLLVLDDATSAVDPRVEGDILGSLRGAGSRDDHPTVVMVAYRMSSVALADAVVHVAGGRVVDTGTHAELMQRDPGYAALATAYEDEAARRADEREGEGS